MTRKTIYVPERYSSKQIGRCRVCGEVFYEGEERIGEEHIIACSTVHADELEARSPARKTLQFLKGSEEGGMQDTELEKWIQAHQTEILERRKRI